MTVTTKGHKMNIYAPHKPEQKKLAEVMAEMEVLGSPEIKAWYNGELYLAVEGSHRIAAAKLLCFDVDIIEVELDDIIDHDMPEVEGKTVNDVLEYLEMSGPCYSF